jgi:hypothetical protein
MVIAINRKTVDKLGLSNSTMENGKTKNGSFGEMGDVFVKFTLG